MSFCTQHNAVLSLEMTNTGISEFVTSKNRKSINAIFIQVLDNTLVYP